MLGIPVVFSVNFARSRRLKIFLCIVSKTQSFITKLDFINAMWVLWRLIISSLVLTEGSSETAVFQSAKFFATDDRLVAVLKVHIM